MKLKKFNCKKLVEALTRRKYYVFGEDTALKRVLTTFDLTALGIGSTLGVGVYVLAGEVAKNYAGPAVVVSFLIAAIASVLAGLCYAEFGVRVPKAGSVYVYTYVCIGEFLAFLVGWNLILEYVIGSASVVKGLFTYLDALVYNAMSNFFQKHMPITIPSIEPFPDLFSLGITLVFSVALAFGAKESSIVNNIFTTVNLIVVAFVIISGFWKVNSSNWSIPKENVPSEKYGDGGFAPYGITGIMKGAATCFYGFIGFDCIATAGEEAKTPKKSIPIAVTVSLLIIFLAYFGISTVLTMMLPYYEQDEKAPFPSLYAAMGWIVAKYAVSIGALCGLFSSLLGSMFPLPRIIYAMACDGLLFEFMGKVHPKFQTPLLGTLCAGLFTGLFACFFELSHLFKIMAICTLVAYSFVSACVIILRYEELHTNKKQDDQENFTLRTFCGQLFNRKQKTPTKLTYYVVSWAVAMFTVNSVIVSTVISQLAEEMLEGTAWVIVITIIPTVVIILTLVSISCQPQSPEKLDFTVPFVPWLPASSMAINIYLMTMLDFVTWIRYGVWMVLGFIVYFSYGIWNSKTGHPSDRNLALNENNREVEKERY